MAVLMVYDATGDPKQLLQSYHKAGLELKGALPEGTLAHICVPTETGFRTFLVMESEQHARNAFAPESFRMPAGAAGGHAAGHAAPAAASHAAGAVGHGAGGAGGAATARDLVHRHGLVTGRRTVQMMPVYAFSVAQDVHEKQRAIASERNGGGGTGPHGSVAVAIGEVEAREP